MPTAEVTKEAMQTGAPKTIAGHQYGNKSNNIIPAGESGAAGAGIYKTALITPASNPHVSSRIKSHGTAVSSAVTESPRLAFDVTCRRGVPRMHLKAQDLSLNRGIALRHFDRGSARNRLPGRPYRRCHL